MGWVGIQKYYVILRVGHGKCLRLITRWVGGVKKGQKHAYVIFEWSLTQNDFILKMRISSRINNLRFASVTKAAFESHFQTQSFLINRKCI